MEEAEECSSSEAIDYSDVMDTRIGRSSTFRCQLGIHDWDDDGDMCILCGELMPKSVFCEED